MSAYSTGFFAPRTPKIIEACQFDGTYAHARWFAEQDPENITVALRPVDRARGLTDDSPARLTVKCGDGAATAAKGDWIVEDDGWEVFSDKGFQANWTPAE